MTNTRRGTPVDDRKIPALLSVVEAAVILDVHRNNVLHMINSGKLPARKVGSTWVIREAVLSAIEVSDATEGPNSDHACAAHDDAHLGHRCPGDDWRPADGLPS